MRIMKKVIESNDITNYWCKIQKPFFLKCPWQGVHFKRGKTLDILELLSELGEVPDTLRNMIESKTDTEILSKWIKAAAKCNTIKEFEDSM